MSVGTLTNLLHQRARVSDDFRSRGLQGIERRWLGPSQYRGVFRLQRSAGLQAALESFARTRPLASVPGLRSARWLQSEREQPARLVFEFNCDGNVLDALEELEEQPLPALEAILEHCDGYPGRGDSASWVRFFRRRRIAGAKLLGDSAPLTPGDEAAPPLPLTAFERLLDHEAEILQLSMQLHRARARRDARTRRRKRKIPNGLRGVHAKHHGLLKAQLRVHDDLPAELRHGVLVSGAKYDAWVRPSNGDPTIRPDWLPDVRGLAIKLLGIEGPALLDTAIPDGITVPPGRTQDFALVSHPVFFMRNARDYLLLRSLLDARPDHAVEWLELLASASVFWLRRTHELSILARTLLRWCRHPLLLEYHSLAAFLLGPANAVKWSLRPTAATERVLRSESLRERVRAFIAAPDSYLSAALKRSLAPGSAPLELEFALHIAREQPLPVEDPTIDWGKLGARRIVVATLSIAAQDPASRERQASAQNMVISPWHSLAAHRPLGSLNRARLGAYLASSQERWRANGVITQTRPKADGARSSAAGRNPSA